MRIEVANILEGTMFLIKSQTKFCLNHLNQKEIVNNDNIPYKYVWILCNFQFLPICMNWNLIIGVDAIEYIDSWTYSLTINTNWRAFSCITMVRNWTLWTVLDPRHVSVCWRHFASERTTYVYINHFEVISKDIWPINSKSFNLLVSCYWYKSK